MNDTPATPDRRASILRAATDLIAERGLSAVRTRDVTERAGVGIGLLNHYFRWSVLRAEAAVAALEAEIAVLIGGNAEGPDARLRAFVTRAFTDDTATLWRLWIEITDAAIADAEVASAMAGCAARLHDGLTGILSDGASAGQWSCVDASGSAMRLLALHDGLAGFVLTGLPPLSRPEASAHFSLAVTRECVGFEVAEA